MDFMYLVFTRMPGESSVGDSGLCCCTRVTYFELELTPLLVDSAITIVIVKIIIVLSTRLEGVAEGGFCMEMAG